VKIHVGTNGYSYKEWIGAFYPEKISPKEMLNFYSQHFDTVEINNTFYHMPTESVLTSWAQKVPRDFVFAVKAPRTITHLKRLRDVGKETKYLFRMLSVLGVRLGPVLFQFPGSFHANPTALKEFLTLIPRTIACAFEFRHASWLDAQILKTLTERNLGLCTADAEENPAREIVSTTSWGYLRLRRTDYTNAELSAWKKKILSQNWDKAFVFFKHEEEEPQGQGPETAIRFRELIDSQGKTSRQKTG